MSVQSSGKVWERWWSIGGFLGIGFIVLFVVGAFVVQTEPPAFDDSMADIREYFGDDDTRYLVGDYLIGLGFVLLFLPFLLTLRGVLGWAEGGANIWSWVAFAGGLATVVIGGAGSAFWGALAFGAINDPEVTDSAVRTLMHASAYAFSMLSLPGALFLFAASAVIFRTSVLWRWLAPLGLAVGVLGVIGAASPIEGDDDGVLAIIGFISLIGFLLWILLASFNMIFKKELPARAAQ